MELTIEIKVTVPDNTESDVVKHVRENVDWAVLTTIDRLRRVLPHSVKVDDATLKHV